MRVPVWPVTAFSRSIGVVISASRPPRSRNASAALIFGPMLPFGNSPSAGARTTLIARTYLDHAARGEYAERVHDLTAAVAAGAEAQVVRGMSWGATSGADLLLGILLGARAAWSTREVRAA